MRTLVLLLAAATAEESAPAADVDGYRSDREVRAAVEDGPWRWTAGGGLWVVSSEATVSKDSIVGGGSIDEDGVIGFAVHVDAFRGPWGVSLEGTFLDVDESGGSAPAQAEHATAHLAAYRRFGGGDTHVDALAGFRLGSCSPDLQNGSVRRPWWDPTFGFRASHRVSERWRLAVRGDVGGFTLGSASDLTWQIEAFLYYGITGRAEAGVGYRHLDIDYATGGLRFRQRAGGPMVVVLVTF